MNQTSIKVTAVIPAYNVGPYIERAINSVLAQTRLPDEIIVVDDGSTDNTAEKIKSFGQKVKYLHQNNAGAGAARNTGIQTATGNWIAFLDADDEWLPQYLQQQLTLLQTNQDLVWSTANYMRCLCWEDRQAPDGNPTDLENRLGNQQYFENYLAAFQQNGHWCTNTMIVKKEVFLKIGVFRENYHKLEDMDMWFRIAFQWPRIGYTSRPLSIYHLDRPDCLSHQTTPANTCIKLIDQLLQLARQHECINLFSPCAKKLLRGWIRGMLFEARKNDIRTLLNQFNSLLPNWYKLPIRCLTVFPKTTAASCRVISHMVRITRFRRQLIRKPQK